jgi:MtN3 and saliva related transmembrane protein
MSNIAILGLVAGALTTISAIPQALKAFKTKKTTDLSLGMYILVTAGIILWLVYGLIIKDIPLIAANVVTLALNIFILLLKIRYG